MENRDGRYMEFRRLLGKQIDVRPTGGEPRHGEAIKMT